MKSILTAGVIAALVVASTATAALVVTSANIKNGTIKMVDIGAGAKRALKGNRGPRGAQGPQGAPGPQGPQGIQRLVRVEASIRLLRSRSRPLSRTAPRACSPSARLQLHRRWVRCRQYPVATGWWVSIDTEGGAFGGSVTAVVLCSPNISPL